MQTSEVLNRAADLIEERGWAQGSPGMFVGEDRPRCIQGAIQAAAGAPTLNIDGDVIYHYIDASPCAAGDAVMCYLGQDARGVWMWNDAPGRTAAEVIEVLRATALIEAAKENAETREPVSA